ncbi:MAG TPA: LysM peptidoglycan-binding domain-containing protein, partial [Candidatus Bathyarchaeia archaeon]|nr:LysM peptidoglycan-binding domain-containing protein [Candidatus Bathyarchaeia archaeon]
VIIIVGVLIFNYFKGNQAELAQETPIEEFEELDWATPEEQAILEAIPETYQVKENESLWKISEKFYQSGYNWSDIAKENNLSNPNLLAVGQELKLPKVALRKPVEEIAQAEPVLGETETSISGDSYVVQKGDSLWKIAIRTYADGYKWTEIAKTNNLAYPDFLEVGQELKLPR